MPRKDWYATPLDDVDKRILIALAAGLRPQDIAIVLNYSPDYIADRMVRIRRNLRAKTQAHAVANAFRSGLIS
jgi:DNA-binding CsgD family transcriptional regulator